MSTKAADQQRLVRVGVGLLAAALGIVALRIIKSGRESANQPLPAADLTTVSAFLAPLPDTSVLAHVSTGTMVIARDPFAASGVARIAEPLRTASSLPPKKEAGGHWIVSSILFEGSEKSAIVNNAWVTIGDSLGGGSRLTAVEADHIVVTDAKGVRHKVPIQGGESW